MLFLEGLLHDLRRLFQRLIRERVWPMKKVINACFNFQETVVIKNPMQDRIPSILPPPPHFQRELLVRYYCTARNQLPTTISDGLGSDVRVLPARRWSLPCMPALEQNGYHGHGKSQELGDGGQIRPLVGICD